jgi:mannose-6-phosphate isomerase-like protein (cupin superfamily)
VNGAFGAFSQQTKNRATSASGFTIVPGKAISLQYHNNRTETWTIVSGEGKVLVDDVMMDVSQGDTIYVPRRAWHKVWCIGDKPLVAIEVQIGECNEEDIVRMSQEFEDGLKKIADFAKTLEDTINP